MKRGPYRKSEPIETTDLCEYGCGSVAKFKNLSGKYICCQRGTSCPVNKKKNSEGLKEAYENEIRPSQKVVYDGMSSSSKEKMNYRKGVFKPVFSENAKISSHKRVLIQERGHRCEICENDTWLGEKIVLEMDHIDGVRTNNLKENLRLLCPNCHSMTPTWRGRNVNSGKMKVTDEDLIYALETQKNIRLALVSVGLAPKGGNYNRCNKLLANKLSGC